MDKLIWRYLLPLLLRIPITRKFATDIWAKKLADIFVQSIKERERVLDDKGLEKYPLIQRLLAYMAIIPAVQIAYFMKCLSTGKKGGDY